jgi:hypothetical protein
MVVELLFLFGDIVTSCDVGLYRTYSCWCIDAVGKTCDR